MTIGSYCSTLQWCVDRNNQGRMEGFGVSQPRSSFHEQCYSYCLPVTYTQTSRLARWWPCEWKTLWTKTASPSPVDLQHSNSGICWGHSAISYWTHRIDISYRYLSNRDACFQIHGCFKSKPVALQLRPYQHDSKEKAREFLEYQIPQISHFY